jgi:ABC-type dipeptide/oligopeptide/nickel transport system permease subunit
MLIFALIILAAMGTGLQNVMIADGISSFPRFPPLVRSLTLSIKNRDYVNAARGVGDSDLRIMFRHIFPSMVGSVMVLVTLQVASSILVGAGLSYLGMGAQPPPPEWGLMCSEGRAFLSLAPWLSTFPGLGILLLVMSTNLMGDGLSVALDPRVAIR